ncbi:microcystin-dependent protein [Mesorhizobium sp. M1A.F.Ca.ET.072.01.1.1]|uniref:phage tail protein n=1 Tax=Mesorhizobium sp. M1A.F.Ca.ET.072.01.1.1 TaxID=2496753 RepID=UPI000FD57304|nr:tail fiber protein [Mesorhizobium sp. M1A.F.Ca.ET.072.01.1.1]RUW46372.1 microcystin-dependent protein [Mesorhizobium sp. M1A.F.Ca.ET.072.01.1.1]TIU97632.1 MAG: microcystin-dependent protein [Mesorhizobium sp.]
MAEVFLGQIMMTGFAFPPKGFAFCSGSLLAIAQNQALFSLLGTTYGGNGTTNFALPNLQSRTPVGFGASVDSAWQPSPYELGETGGAENVTLLTQQLPTHNHVGNATTTEGSGRSPTNALYGATKNAIYGAPNGRVVTLAAPTVTSVGGNQPHPNIQPYETINFNIAINGIYPSRP